MVEGSTNVYDPLSVGVLPAIKKGTKVTLQSSSSLSLSDDNKEALG